MAATLQHVAWILWQRRWLLGVVLIVLLGAAAVSLMVGAPTRLAGDVVALDAYGYAGVQVQIIHPARLLLEPPPARAEAITVLARALNPEATRRITFVLPLPNESVAYVNREGAHVPGRLEVTPGYPEAAPFDLLVVHGDALRRGGGLRPRRVTIAPLILSDERYVVVPELQFTIGLENRWERFWRVVAEPFVSLALPLLAVGAVVSLAYIVWRRLQREQMVEREKQLAVLYSELREHIKLERWADARERIERIRLAQPRYRDVDQLDTLVSSAETAAWRREELYRAGWQAYQMRDWPSAVQAFSAVERETPYYQDVLFMRRTAMLYANLSSRDRSLRLAAARELGQVADLLDMTPLLQALADPSSEVADAAEESFRRIGLAAFETLVAGLAHPSSAVRDRSYRLLESFGQSARDALLGALRSSDPRISAAVARLLINLGAARELAQALLWAPREHQEGLVAALVGDGVASSGPLIEALLQATSERQPVILGAIGALKVGGDIERRLVEAMRAQSTPALKALLQRAIDAPAAPFRALDPMAPAFAESSRPALGEIVTDGKNKARRVKLLDKRL